MPLRSSLFADSAPLQACLESDAAHVVPGAQGDHVMRIQSALVRLRFLGVGDARAEATQYGPRTAAAVLAYKRRFKIINARYQSQPDNIVGRMTIASLDHAIWTLDGGGGKAPAPRRPGQHPPSPGTSGGTVGGTVGVGASRPAVTASPPPASFLPPLSDLPADVQETIRRTNDAKKPDLLLLYPFLAKHEGPLAPKELSARFGGGNAGATDILRALHARMKPFGIWKNIRIIVNVYQGTGSQGLFCEPFDHDAMLKQMTALTTGPATVMVMPNMPLTDSKFCRDAFNVHGPRDSFREMVKQGPGLHICITQPQQRASEPCDLHIDEIQQGQVCSGGFCIPIVNGQTIDHLRTVGPWLADEARKFLDKIL
ncbi:hypothetical protein [Vineibacter terrae]|uniref:peptidoglycan-binding domain-containing protein n=1 Tax=Vineibacter terrae TaxID=2586908 RepID=UPI002E3454EA|nr:hypothetical protein [Vineibacter terrae]HEX2885076.1 hypothetical protein [Vineibacter terrae]